MRVTKMRTGSYFKATCDFCSSPLWGMIRKLGGQDTYSWSHVSPEDRAKNGMHGAFPARGTIVEIQRAEFAELSKASR